MILLTILYGIKTVAGINIFSDMGIEDVIQVIYYTIFGD